MNVQMPATLVPYWNSLIEYFHHAQFCWANGLRAQGCHDFWVQMLFAAVGIGSLICLRIIWSSLRKIRAHKSYQKWLADREKVMAPEEMAKVKWQGDETAVQDLSQKELADKIRQAIKK